MWMSMLNMGSHEFEAALTLNENVVSLLFL
jgi:hypothetical protein